MAFSRDFHKGANRNHLIDALNPFKHLVPVQIISDDSKNELDSTLPVSHQVKQEELGHEHGFKFEVVPAHHVEKHDWPIPSESRGCDDSV